MFLSDKGGREISMLENYLDQFLHHLDKELVHLCKLYLRKENEENVEHSEFRESRGRISILIQTMSEIQLLEQSNSDYIGSGVLLYNY